MIRTATALVFVSFAAAGLAGVGLAAPVRYAATAPETATLAPGPNSELAHAHCAICHSVDYITTQPRSFADPRAVWTAEVAKMRKVYGAELTDQESTQIVDYLVVTYGR